MVKRVETIRELRLVLETWRRRDETIGFIPTMGNLHGGHISLLRQAQSLSTRVVTSIFVNPLQFGPDDGFETYPRSIEEDEKKLTENGCDLLFAPSVETLYPSGHATLVDPGALGHVFEGINKPFLFPGIATLVTKLLLLVMPDYAFFGEKDYQQYRLIEQVVHDLQIPVGLIPVPTARDHDDLPLSSRNASLPMEARPIAALFPKTLETMVEEINAGHDIDSTLMGGQEQLCQYGFTVDYLELVDARTMDVVRTLRKPARLIAAVHLGKVRLIDNMPV